VNRPLLWTVQNHAPAADADPDADVDPAFPSAADPGDPADLADPAWSLSVWKVPK